MKKGISLIVLVITIIVIIILATTILFIVTDNNIIDKAYEFEFKSNIDSYKTTLDLYHKNEMFEDRFYNKEQLNALTWDGNSSSIVGTVKEYIPIINVENGKKFEIHEGELVYAGSDAKEKSAAETIGIKTFNIERVKELGVSYSSVVALSNLGNVKAWGVNNLGQLGNGNFNPVTLPSTSSGFINVKKTVSGQNTNFFFSTNGKIYGTGRNDTYQLTNGNTNNVNVPVEIKGISNVKDIIASDFTTYALMED